MTVNPPDATPRENRGAQTRRGQAAKGRRGGRPRKPTLSRAERDAAFRAQWLDAAHRLLAEGLSLTQIAQQLSATLGRRITRQTLARHLIEDKRRG